MSEAEHDALRKLWLMLQANAREYERVSEESRSYERRLKSLGRASAYRNAAERLGKACGFSKRQYPGVQD